MYRTNVTEAAIQNAAFPNLPLAIQMVSSRSVDYDEVEPSHPSPNNPMNTTEQIVESYYRICHECFTVPDVKVMNAYSRQFDLLANSLRNDQQYHIEVSVSHVRQWAPKSHDLLAKLAYKFLGVPNRRESKKLPAKESYLRQIHSTYNLFGMTPSRVRRVWVCWELPADDDFDDKLTELLIEHEQEDNPIQIVSFKHTIIPALKRRIKTAHYDDVALRTISLFNQGKKQVNVDHEKGRQRDISAEDA